VGDHTSAWAHSGPLAIDANAPLLKFTRKPAKIVGSTSVEFKVSTQGDDDIATIECKIDGRLIWKKCVDTVVTLARLQVGKHTFSATATSPTGVASSISFEWTRKLGYGGTRLDDIFRGTADNDTFYGLGGSDAMYGGARNDRLDGNAGDDHIFGNAGEDELRGGPGDDTVEGGNDRDLILGGAGDDLIFAHDARQDIVDCGPGKHDIARVDRKDKVSGCETVKRFAPH
jgi:Ca2+-binding RTX toxin-like protein